MPCTIKKWNDLPSGTLTCIWLLLWLLLQFLIINKRAVCMQSRGRRAGGAVCFKPLSHYCTSCVSRMLDSIQIEVQWPSLESRRRNARLVMLYKIHHQTVACPLKLLAAPKRQRRGHDQQLQLATPQTEYRRGSFVPCTIREWNDWPSGTVTFETLDNFVSRLVH